MLQTWKLALDEKQARNFYNTAYKKMPSQLKSMLISLSLICKLTSLFKHSIVKIKPKI